MYYVTITTFLYLEPNMSGTDYSKNLQTCFWCYCPSYLLLLSQSLLILSLSFLHMFFSTSGTPQNKKKQLVPQKNCGVTAANDHCEITGGRHFADLSRAASQHRQLNSSCTSLTRAPVLAGAGAPVLVAKQKGRAMKTEQDCLISNSCCVLFLTAFRGGPKGKRF